MTAPEPQRARHDAIERARRFSPFLGEALILVGAGGFAYEEAAEICGCAVGTIKSRVARGRVALEQLLSSGKLPSRRQHKTDPDKSALQTIMGEVDELSRDQE
jgi:RNA polymerase sigma-70 factor (ECF subfamily)